MVGHPQTDNRPGLLPARKEFGDWQMFPRDAAAVPWIQDGRWRLGNRIRSSGRFFQDGGAVGGAAG